MSSSAPDEPGLDARLRVVRLARPQRHAEANGDRPGVAEPVALRVLEDGLDPVAQAPPVAAERRLARVQGERAPAGQAAVLARLLFLVRQILREEVGLGRDGREGEGEADACSQHDGRRHDRPPAAERDGQHDEGAGKREQRRA